MRIEEKITYIYTSMEELLRVDQNGYFLKKIDKNWPFFDINFFSKMKTESLKMVAQS